MAGKNAKSAKKGRIENSELMGISSEILSVVTKALNSRVGFDELWDKIDLDTRKELLADLDTQIYFTLRRSLGA